MDNFGPKMGITFPVHRHFPPPGGGFPEISGVFSQKSVDKSVDIVDIFNFAGMGNGFLKVLIIAGGCSPCDARENAVDLPPARIKMQRSAAHLLQRGVERWG